MQWWMKENVREAIRKAEKLAKKVEHLDDSLYVNLDNVLEYIKNKLKLNIKFSLLDIKKFADEIKNEELKNADGFIFSVKRNNKKVYYIGVNNTSNTKLFQRFTLAHELGHLYLGHHDKKDGFKGGFKISAHISYDISTSNGNDEEMEANAFALALLMPKDSFELLYKTLECDINELGDLYRVAENAVLERIKIFKEIKM